MKNKLWGGRFEKKTDPLVEEFTRSIQYDGRLAKWDCLGSIAHVTVLKKAGYLKATEASRLVKALRAIIKSIDAGSFSPDMDAEDIHSDIQNRVAKAVGPIASKLHTARSRNDQVVLATKLYCVSALEEIGRHAGACMSALKRTGSRQRDTIMPGFTHLQHAQPVLVKDVFNAYACMLQRDQARFKQAAANIRLVFGAGALAGTPVPASSYAIPIPEMGRKLHPVNNSLDTVSDRDFILECLFAFSVCAMHLSRIAEDLVLWASKEFGFVELDDAYCTGSSLMPQKKNPDTLELTRGYAGRLYGNLMSVLTMMKGLPLSYNRDMQLDKEPLFQSCDVIQGALKVLTGLIKTLKFKKDTIAGHLKDESLYATDLVYYLVDKKVSFKEAHTIIGKLVKYSLDNKIEIKKMSQEVLNTFSDKLILAEIVPLFNPVVSVRSKRSIKRS